MIHSVFTIINEKGLHARASAKFVEAVEQHKSQVFVEKDDIKVDGNSIMGLMTLGAAQGCRISVTIDGPDEAKLNNILDNLIKNRFFEALKFGKS